MKRSLLIICNSDLSREPRVIRQIIALKDEYDVHTLGAKPSSFNEIQHYNFVESNQKPKHWSYPAPIRKAYSGGLFIYERLKSLYPALYFEKDFWTADRKDTLAQLPKKDFDVIIAHHWDSLPLATTLSASGKAKIIFNAHDYYPRQFEKNPNWVKHQKQLVEHVMNKHVPKCNLIFSAWTKIHDDFQKFYGVPSIIITNATEYNELSPKLKTADDNKIKIIHHGIANSNRKIEKMIEVMDYLDDRFYLDLMVIPSSYEMDYFNMLKQMASKNPRIQFIEPVPTREIPKRINEYDIGLFLLPPNGFNPTYTLPNKLFEFIQGRLACLVSPNIEMKMLVEDYDLGWVSEDYEPLSVANKIAKVSNDQLNEKKQNAHKNALQLAAEVNYRKIKDSVKEVINN